MERLSADLGPLRHQPWEQVFENQGRVNVRKMLKRFHKGVDMKNEMLALILAGKNSSWKAHTKVLRNQQYRSGGRYRIIDSRRQTVPTLGLTMV